MADERKIAPVADNKDKQQTYRYLAGRRKAAMAAGFYLETIHINYAIIEDRTHSLFYHLGYLPNRSTPTKCGRRLKPFFREVFEWYAQKHNSGRKNMTIDGLENKLTLIESIAEYVVEHETSPVVKDSYYNALRTRLEKYGVENVRKLVGATRKWKAYRNEVTHALANKSLFSMQETLQTTAEQGKRLGDAFDRLVDCVGRGNGLRKSVKLSVD